jgi:NADH-quinone oxidoreductase subunit A
MSEERLRSAVDALRRSVAEVDVTETAGRCFASGRGPDAGRPGSTVFPALVRSCGKRPSTCALELAGHASPGLESAPPMTEYFQAYGTLAALLVLAIAFVAVAFTANRVLRPNRPSAAKLTTYESGIDPVGTTWSQTQIRYYVFAFLFVIFDVESVFLFPWAVVFADLGVAAFWEMVVFIAVLAVGLLYAYKKGVLRWA